MSDIRILCVGADSDFEGCWTKRLAAEREAFTVVHVSDGDAALERLSQEPCDCVVSDYHLPGTNGIELLEAVRECHPELPFLLSTADGSEEVAGEAITAGATDFFSKAPTHARVLGKRIENVVSTYRSQVTAEGAEERFRKLVEHSTDLIFTVDADGINRYIAPSVENVLGYDPDDLLGENAFEYVHPEDRQRASDAFAEALDNPDQPTTVEFRARHADGSWRTLEVKGRNLLDDPTIEAFVVNGRDVTERKRTMQRLRERETVLERQRDELRRLDQINMVIRGIDRTLVGATTREQIESAVCKRLVASDLYHSAWIGEYTTSREVQVRASAGVPEQAVTAIEPDERTGTFLGGDVLPQSVAVVRDIETLTDSEPWAGWLVNHDVKALLATQVEFEGSRYGVLTVHADRDSAFSKRERAVFEEFGGMIGHAITALERKEALLSDSVFEIELWLPSVPATPDEAVEATVEETVSIDGSANLLFVSVDGITPETVRETFGQLPVIEHVRHIRSRGDRSVFELAVQSPSAASILAAHNGRLRTVTVATDGTYLMAEVPATTDVRSLVASMSEHSPNVELLSKRSVCRTNRYSLDFWTELDDRLTDSQRSVLKAAYFSGYFARPRETIGKELAERFDITPQALHQHLRAGLRHLLSVTFESRAAEGVPE